LYFNSYLIKYILVGLVKIWPRYKFISVIFLSPEEFSNSKTQLTIIYELSSTTYTICPVLLMFLCEIRDSVLPIVVIDCIILLIGITYYYKRRNLYKIGTFIIFTVFGIIV